MCILDAAIEARNHSEGRLSDIAHSFITEILEQAVWGYRHSALKQR
jgi:hypothetical protein